MTAIYKKRSSCAICSNKELELVLDYGQVPLAGEFPLTEDLNKTQKFPLQILFCPYCGLMQTDSVIDADSLFKDYRYMSSVGLSQHFKNLAAKLKADLKLDSQSKILEIGSNDGVLLKPLNDLGLNALGFEPAVNISEIARSKGCGVITDYFSAEAVDKHSLKNNFDLIVSCNCFAHIDDIHSIVRGVKAALKPNGTFAVEVHYLKELVEKLQYDNIYHEHIYYYSLNALNYLFALHGMLITKFEEIPIHSGSMRVYVKNDIYASIDAEVGKRLDDEIAWGMTESEFYGSFSSKVLAHIDMVKTQVHELIKGGAKVVGYGASGRANMLCNLCEFTPDIIPYVVDESPERKGRVLTGVGIPIVGKEKIEEAPPTHVLIFAWNFSQMIIKKLEGKGLKFIVAFPDIQIVERAEELKNYGGI